MPEGTFMFASSEGDLLVEIMSAAAMITATVARTGQRAGRTNSAASLDWVLHTYTCCI